MTEQLVRSLCNIAVGAVEEVLRSNQPSHAVAVGNIAGQVTSLLSKLLGKLPFNLLQGALLRIAHLAHVEAVGKVSSKVADVVEHALDVVGEIVLVAVTAERVRRGRVAKGDLLGVLGDAGVLDLVVVFEAVDGVAKGNEGADLLGRITQAGKALAGAQRSLTVKREDKLVSRMNKCKSY